MSGPRAAGRVEKIFAQEGDRLHAGQPIVQLEASELLARRDLAAAQIETALRDVDSQTALLDFLRDDAKRQQDLLKRKVVSPTDAQKADSSARAEEKIVEAAKMRVVQARAQLADIDAQLAEMQVIAPTDSVLEVLSVKVGDVLAGQSRSRHIAFAGAFVGARFCAGTVAGPDQSGRSRPGAGRFIPGQGFRRRGRAGESSGRVHAAQCANRGGPNSPGLRRQDSIAEQRRQFARRHVGGCLFSECKMNLETRNPGIQKEKEYPLFSWSSGFEIRFLCLMR